jgi:hypothetical protein
MAAIDMFQHLARVLAAEIALHKHNKVNRQGIVSPHAQHFIVLKNILPEDVFRGLQDAASHLQASSVREDSHWRKGQAIGGHELGRSSAAPWLEHICSPRFRQSTREATGIKTLELVPDVDTNRISLLFYDGPKRKDTKTDLLGDGTDWHMDGNIYLGDRWAGILTLVEDTLDDVSKLELQPNGQITQIPKAQLENSLILFQGDHVLHRVRAMAPGERRVVISLLFSDWPVRTRNPLLRRYQSKVNLAFYGNPSS